MGRGLLSFLAGFPSLWLLFRSSSLISTPSSSENVFIRISSVLPSLLSLSPCKTRQFRREYCSKSSISVESLFCYSIKFSMLFSNWLIFSSFFLISFSRSSKFADIKSSDSVTLIWDSFTSSWKVKGYFTWFSLQFTSNFANSGELKNLRLVESLDYRFVLLSLNSLHLLTCQRDLLFCFPRKNSL